jgi:hypothetical protein
VPAYRDAPSPDTESDRQECEDADDPATEPIEPLLPEEREATYTIPGTRPTML